MASTPGVGTEPQPEPPPERGAARRLKARLGPSGRTRVRHRSTTSSCARKFGRYLCRKVVGGWAAEAYPERPSTAQKVTGAAIEYRHWTVGDTR